MKRQRYLLLFFVFLVSIYNSAGCKKEEKKESNLISLSESGIEKIEAPQGCEIISNPDKFVEVTNEQSYNSEIDDPGFTVTYGLADAREAMFYMANNYLYYYDKEKNKCGLLCNKPDCSHIKEDSWTCNASVPFGEGLAYSKGNLYTVNSETMELIKIFADTLERVTVGKLCTVPEDKIEKKDGIYALEWIIHKDYIYYYYQLYSGLTEDTYYLNGSNCVYRMSLDGNSEPECIFPFVCESNSFYTRIKGNGSYVYMNTTQKEKNSGYLYRYNIEAGNVEKLEFLGDDIINYTIKDNIIYYSNASEPQNIYYYDGTTEKSQLFFSVDDDKYQYLGCSWSDKDYIYIGYNMKEESDKYSGGMLAFDWQGNMVADIPWIFYKGESWIMDYFCGISDERLYFLKLRGGEENPWIQIEDNYKIPYYIEKTDLADGAYEIHEAEK